MTPSEQTELTISSIITALKEHPEDFMPSLGSNKVIRHLKSDLAFLETSISVHIWSPFVIHFGIIQGFRLKRALSSWKKARTIIKVRGAQR
jgi:hypothetical protein